MKLPHKITPLERNRIVALLAAKPIGEVRTITGRSLKTLFRIAEVTL